MADRERCNAASSVFQSLQGMFGGGGASSAGGGIYGTLTDQSTHNVLGHVVTLRPVDKDSIFLDIGSGLHKMCFFATYGYAFPVSMGLENDPSKCYVASCIAKAVAADQARFQPERRAPDVILGDIMQMYIPGVSWRIVCLHHATHVYTFWKGMPTEVQEEIVRKVRACSTVMVFAAVGCVASMKLAESKFGGVFEMQAMFPVTQSGSGSAHQAGIFLRVAEFQPPESKCPNYQYCDTVPLFLSNTLSVVASDGDPWHNRDVGRVKFVYNFPCDADRINYERLYGKREDGQPRRSGRQQKAIMPMGVTQSGVQSE